MEHKAHDANEETADRAFETCHFQGGL